MNAPASQLSARVRLADLSDPGECARIVSFVRATDGATPFHLPQWITAMETGCGQTAHMLVAERGNAIVGVLPANVVHSPLVGRALVSSGFAVGGGILADDPAVISDLANNSWALAERLSCPEVELRGGPVPEGWDARSGLYANFSRELAEDAEADLLSVNRKHRAEIRKSFKNDLSYSVGNGRAERDQHYAIYATSVRNLGTPVFPRSMFDAVLDNFGDDADIMVVHHDGQPISAVLTLYFEGRAMVYWGGGTMQARALRANDFLYITMMNHARERGCTVFDFGRSKRNTGPYKWKKNWGFEPEPMVYASRLVDGMAPREMNPNSPKYRLQVALWKKLPLPIANRVGPWIAKGLG
ncbi:FemAB family PEP-CTERM system-associated protein [Parasphingopyxis sp. CP4]|uniref:FemAB family XrtA/PEP-CTERM system-associated protein n=1 Tax=Parasphingopyxis sp. CP4 TaxID=2724527 RepID=UPI0015A1B430|nr:FemAB family XrtA/PEP-CTERM system-associated protein [Parasphingopyxis sp. CP4]QLC21417.1 FemAB family PEP-CTERM system-associated protein [Parasphingopyxis sp. CP4]